jgi:hypothetical protein
MSGVPSSLDSTQRARNAANASDAKHVARTSAIV